MMTVPVHTDIRNWFVDTYSKFRQDGLSGLAWGFYHLYLGFWITLTSRFTFGTNVFERDWDVLIVLDACRVDALEEVKNDYEFINSIDSIYSVGSTSSEWISKTFTETHREEMKNTSYITGNPYAELLLKEQQSPPATETNSISMPVPICSPEWDTLAEEDLHELNVTRQIAEDDRGWIKPRPITEQAIHANRNTEADKLVVHYMQPHRPYIGEDIPNKVQGTNITGKLINNELSKDQVWGSYISTLHFILDEVELLLQNIDAENVVITADHGEGFGEHGSYGHDFGWPHPVEKKVPWVETTAFDKEEYAVDGESNRNDEESTTVEERLSNLGYIDY